MSPFQQPRHRPTVDVAPVDASPSPPADGRAVLRRALVRHRRRLGGSFVLLALWQLCEVMVPVAIGSIVEVAILPVTLPEMIISLVVLAALFLLLSRTYGAGARRANAAQHDEGHRLRVEIAEHALRPTGTDSTLLPGEVVSLASADADVAAGVLRQTALGVAAASGVLVSVIVLVITDPVSAAVAVAGVSITLLTVRALSPVITRASDRQQRRLAAASGLATDLMRGLRVIKGVGGEEAAAARFLRANRLTRDAAVATAGRVAGMDGVGQLLLGLVVAAVLVVGGTRVVAGEVGIGELVTIVGVATYLAEPMTRVAGLAAGLAQARAAGDRIAAYLSAPPLLASGADRPDDDTGGRTPALTVGPVDRQPGPAAATGPVQWSVAEGEFVAVVVADPADRQELVAGLAGEAHAGCRVEVEGSPRGRLDPRFAQHLIAVIPHHADVFAGTIADNVAVATAGEDRAEPDEARLAAAVTDAAADDLLALFADGERHRVEAGGTNLSGGQRQRLALARALYADPAVLVLVDPTSAVDAVTEATIAERVHRRRTLGPSGAGAAGHAGTSEHPHPRTTVVITMSPAFLAVADRVVVLDAGRLAWTGPHTRLLADHPSYRELVAR